MIGTILSIVGMILLFYIFIKTKRIENKSNERMRELEIIYSIGFKEYKSNPISKLPLVQ